MSNIATGVITCGIRILHPNILKYNPTIFVDKDRNGAAYGKNELIHKFYTEGKEHIFLFDDDCYCAIDGWQERIIEWAKKYDVHYLAGLDFKNIHIVAHQPDTVVSKDPYIGGYYYMDSKCIETIGYYNERLVKYGWEDVTYAIRAYKAGIIGHFGNGNTGTGSNGYPTPIWINMYMHACDMFDEKNKPNMEQDEKNKYVELNKAEAQREANEEGYIGYKR